MKTDQCVSCGESLPIEKLIEFNESLWCAECLDEISTNCAVCGTQIFLDDAKLSPSNEDVCLDCYQECYSKEL
jgi:formylmethanofuran dehydrogenase subunit E